MEDLALKESHPVDDGKTDDECKLGEVVEEENLQAHYTQEEDQRQLEYVLVQMETGGEDKDLK